MGEKIAKLGIKREKDMMYYVKGGDVWATTRKRPGVPKGKPQKIAAAGVQTEDGYLYYVDREGDVARAARQVGGSKRKKSAKKSSKKSSKKAKKTGKKGGKKGGGKKGKRK